MSANPEWADRVLVAQLVQMSALPWPNLSKPQRFARMGACLSAWAAGTDEEICGLLYPDGPVTVPNVAPNARTAYAMDPDQQYAIMAARGWPEATYHTHPGGRREPSDVDHHNALTNVPYMIGCVGWAGVWLDGERVYEFLYDATA